jgi:peptidoglycan hydrolase CwlO-like protein
MESLMVEVVVASLGFLTTCVGAARYLAGYWFKQQKEMRNLEKRVYDQAIDSLSKETTSLKDKITAHSKKLEHFEAKIMELVKQFVLTQEQGEAVISSFRAFSEDTTKRFNETERKLDELAQRSREYNSQIIALNRDLIMIKGTKKE